MNRLEITEIPCDHPMEELYYYPAHSNAGWRCLKCQAELGERVGLDQKRTYIKIRGLMDDLREAKFIYISNGTEGDCFMEHIRCQCAKSNDFTQDNIVFEILKKHKQNRDLMHELVKDCAKTEFPMTLQGGKQD